MQKTNEFGRSMVEMLAVLAIAGVITVGGMSGFRTAMNKMRANAIAEVIAEMSVNAQTQNRCLDLEDLDDIENIKCVEDMRGGTNGQVKITFKDDEQCDQIKELVGNTFGSIQCSYCLYYFV